jgi:predicted DNA-binding transcriptional regulator
MVEYTKPMNGAEIAREIGITRQAVSYTLRKSMVKMYHAVIDKGWASSPFEAVVVLMTVLNVNNGDMKDIQEFISLFNLDIQEDVKKDALEKYGDRCPELWRDNHGS